MKADIVGSAYVAALYIKNNLKSGKVYLIGMKGIEDELRNLGIEFIGGESDSEHIVLDDLKYLKPDPEIGAVVVGLDVNLNYKKLAKAHIYLSNPNVLFVATNLDSTFPCDQVDLPGTGSIVSCLAQSLNRSPIILGKPNVEMLNLLLSEFHLDSKSTVMIGDRLDSDIAFGKNGNLFTILVLTGVSNRKDVEDCDFKPDLILESVGDLTSLV